MGFEVCFEVLTLDRDDEKAEERLEVEKVSQELAFSPLMLSRSQATSLCMQ